MRDRTGLASAGRRRTNGDVNIRYLLGIEGKRVLVTGASSGIGLATAIEIANHGGRVVALARNSARLADTMARLQGTGHSSVEYDLSDLDGIPVLVQRIARSMEGLDAIVHCAGLHSARPLASVEPTDIRRVMDVNVNAAIMLAKGFRHRQVQKVAPSIVLLSSSLGLVGQAGTSVYSASKGALVSLAKSLALELARQDIRVNAVCPGIVETEMTENLARTIGPQAFESIRLAHPLGLGTPQDVAATILFLISDASRWITGSVIAVDGGYTAQ
ncbi:SDR family NAD(P)-dependent oxidoreductase [Cryobacterium sp. TMT1-21]|uniref:SDR family NAD(P)-dependent oxidoreductase n=1 Tax=Cryobacterium sp. TMT1-21 TaxID=1259234 RepID=UPI001F5405C1|nr:SDR family oxidoreductase [Cryobacterium sp. TMT1-21]